MAYFRCTTGGSGKGNTLVVTCADDLAGATITCTNGTKTYRKTCPSTAPYEVTFYGLEAGTWTVSAAVSGTTYIITAVITDYEAELGGFNWKTWVDLSENYTSSDFTDLDDLMSDETAIRELMTIHDCVDYLASSTASLDVETIIGNDLCAKWINLRDYALDTLYANTIIADYMDEADKYFYGEWVITDNTTTPPTWGPKGNVPIMTGYSAPYGTVIYSSENNPTDRPAWKLFNGSNTDNIPCSGASVGQYFGYKFTNPVCATMFAIKDGNGRFKTYKIRASNDNSTWDDVADVLSLSGSGTPIETHLIEKNGVLNNKYYLYYEFYCVTADTSNPNNGSIVQLQFYGRELSVSVPTMTGYTTPYGEVVSSGYEPISGSDSTYGAWHAFDSVNSGAGHLWRPEISGTTHYIGYKFVNPMCAKKVVVDIGSSKRSSSFVVKGSNDYNTWYPLSDSITVEQTSTGTAVLTTKIVDINNDNVYRHYKLEIVSTQDNTWGGITIGELQFYGVDYSEKEFEEGTTKKWLYDHGLELENLTIPSGISSSDGSAVKNINDILLTGLRASPNSGNIYPQIYSTSKVDCTSYSLFRIRYSNKLKYDQYNRYGMMAGSNTVPRAVGDATSGTGVFNVSVSNSVTSVDLSSVSGECYLEVFTNGACLLSFNELWLE